MRAMTKTAIKQWRHFVFFFILRKFLRRPQTYTHFYSFSGRKTQANIHEYIFLIRQCTCSSIHRKGPDDVIMTEAVKAYEFCLNFFQRSTKEYNKVNSFLVKSFAKLDFRY